MKIDFKNHWQIYVGVGGLVSVVSVLIVRHYQHNAIVKKMDAAIQSPNASSYGDSRDLNNQSFWDRAYSEGKTTSIYVSGKGTDFAKTIYNAKTTADSILNPVGSFIGGILGQPINLPNDGKEVLQVFNQLQYKADVSKLADAFYVLYQTPILDYLNSFMGADGMNKINDITKSLKD